jgi:hypothetical protein
MQRNTFLFVDIIVVYTTLLTPLYDTYLDAVVCFPSHFEKFLSWVMRAKTVSYLFPDVEGRFMQSDCVLEAFSCLLSRPMLGGTAKWTVHS